MQQDIIFSSKKEKNSSTFPQEVMLYTNTFLELPTRAGISGATSLKRLQFLYQWLTGAGSKIRPTQHQRQFILQSQPSQRISLSWLAAAVREFASLHAPARCMGNPACSCAPASALKIHLYNCVVLILSKYFVLLYLISILYRWNVYIYLFWK